MNAVWKCGKFSQKELNHLSSLSNMKCGMLCVYILFHRSQCTKKLWNAESDRRTNEYVPDVKFRAEALRDYCPTKLSCAIAHERHALQSKIDALPTQNVAESAPIISVSFTTQKGHLNLQTLLRWRSPQNDHWIRRAGRRSSVADHVASLLGVGG